MASCLAYFPLLVSILPVKSPYTLTIIARDAPLVLLVVAGHGRCCRVFGIWDNRLSSHPLWKLIYGLLGWVPTISIPLLIAVFLDMALFITLVTSYIWPGRWLFSRATTISNASDIEINMLQSRHKYVKKGHIKKDCRSTGNGSNGNTPKNSINKLP